MYRIRIYGRAFTDVCATTYTELRAVSLSRTAIAMTRACINNLGERREWPPLVNVMKRGAVIK